MGSLIFTGCTPDPGNKNREIMGPSKSYLAVPPSKSFDPSGLVTCPQSDVLPDGLILGRIPVQ